jgi:hypothetical protein
MGRSFLSDDDLSPGAMAGSAVMRRRLAIIRVNNPLLFFLKLALLDFMVIPFYIIPQYIRFLEDWQMI